MHWSNGFLPASAQGTAFRSSGDPVPDLATPPGVSAESRRAGLGWLEKMNSEYAEAHPGESAIEARVRSYEVAASMQLQVPEIADTCQKATPRGKSAGGAPVVPVAS